MPNGRRRTVTLRPGGTAHALLAVVVASNFAGCHVVRARGLRVHPPRDRAATITGFSFAACRNRRISVLGVGPVRPGTGIPGFTSN